MTVKACGSFLVWVVCPGLSWSVLVCTVNELMSLSVACRFGWGFIPNWRLHTTVNSTAQLLIPLETWTGYNDKTDYHNSPLIFFLQSDAINFNSCQPEPCHNSGRCVRNSTHHSGFFCDCSEPYNGDLCQYNSAVCLDNTEICGEHGICAIKDRRVICQCNLHWIGQW